MKRKEHLLRIQTHAGQKQVLMLLMDMKVCWSSTYNMLIRALKLKEVCHIPLYHFPWANMSKFLKQFIFEIAQDEPDLEKRRKLKALVLSEEEWKRVELLMKLLRVCYYRFWDMEIFVTNTHLACRRCPTSIFI